MTGLELVSSGSGADRRNHTGLRGGYDERRDSNFFMIRRVLGTEKMNQRRRLLMLSRRENGKV